MSETVIKMPSQYPGLPDPIITAIYKKAGDTVRIGETLFSYSFDGALLDETSDRDGKVLDCFVTEGKSARAGEVIFLIS